MDYTTLLIIFFKIEIQFSNLAPNISEIRIQTLLSFNALFFNFCFFITNHYTLQLNLIKKVKFVILFFP